MSKQHKISQTKKKLAQLEMLFEHFFENAPEGIAIIDVKSLKFIHSNLSALHLLKLRKEEINQIGPIDMSPEFQPDGQRSMAKAMYYVQQALKGEKPVFEWLFKFKNGCVQLVEVRMVALKKASDVQLYVSFVNIMERKESEEKLKRQNKKLTEIAFLQSHQVRQPISSLLGLIGLFNFKDDKDPINKQVLTRIKTAAQQFDEIIQEIVTKTNEINQEEPEFTGEQDIRQCHLNTPCTLLPFCYAKSGYPLPEI